MYCISFNCSRFKKSPWCSTFWFWLNYFRQTMSLIDITHHQQPIVVSLVSWFRTACKHTESLLLDLSNLEFTRKPGVSNFWPDLLTGKGILQNSMQNLGFRIWRNWKFPKKRIKNKQHIRFRCNAFQRMIAVIDHAVQWTVHMYKYMYTEHTRTVHSRVVKWHRSGSNFSFWGFRECTFFDKN